MTRIFTYGTLRKGCGLHRILSSQQYVKDAYVQGKLIDLGGCPGLIEGGSLVKGEVYDIDNPTLACLDNIELGAGYQREHWTLEDGDMADLYVYKYPEGCQEIPGGDWIRYLQGEQVNGRV